MAQAQGTGLAHIGKIHVIGLHGAHQFEQSVLLRYLKLVLELVSSIKVIFYGRLLRPVTKIMWRMPAA